MLKKEYKALRGLLRANGSYAYRWMLPSQQAPFKALQEQECDYLARRAEMESPNIPLSAPLAIFMAWRYRCENKAK